MKVKLIFLGMIAVISNCYGLNVHNRLSDISVKVEVNLVGASSIACRNKVNVLSPGMKKNIKLKGCYLQKITFKVLTHDSTPQFKFKVYPTMCVIGYAKDLCPESLGGVVFDKTLVIEITYEHATYYYWCVTIKGEKVWVNKEVVRNLGRAVQKGTLY